MELKLQRLNVISRSVSRLLIVPYGIETLLNAIVFVDNRQLLIVPYGIETRNFRNDG